MAATFGGSGANGATPWGDTGYAGPYVTNQQANSVLGQNYAAPNNDPISFSDVNQKFPTLNYTGNATPTPAPLPGAAAFGGSPGVSMPIPPGMYPNSGSGVPGAGVSMAITPDMYANSGSSFTNTKGPYQAGGGGYTAGQNPYLNQMGDALVQQNTQNFNRNVMPRIASQAMAAGGYGGSRQGVVEANAMNDLNTGNANALASLYGNGYNTALQYDLGRRGNDLGYYSATNQNNQAMGNLGLGYAGLDRQINNDNLSWQQQGYNNNMGLYGQLMNNNQTGINAGTQIQNTPMNYWSQFGNQYNSIGQGYNSTTTSGGGGNPLMGAIGGAQLGGQVANWWNGGGNSSQPYNPATSDAMANSLNSNGYWQGPG